MFIVFEGMDGSGKTTQAQMLHNYLTRHCLIPTRLVREPGSTRLGEMVRQIIFEFPDTSTREEALLFNLARCRLVDTMIIPALQDGKWVICDRFTTSTAVYQGDESVPVSEYASFGLEPDMEILLDLEPRIARQRKHGSGDINRFDEKINQIVRNRYLKWSRKRQTSLVVDAGKSQEEVSQYIFGWLRPAISMEIELTRGKNNGG